MRAFFLLVFCLLLTATHAQPVAPEYVDVIQMRGGRDLFGSVLSYTHGKRVTIVQQDGTLKEVDWADIKRVSFQIDRVRLAAIRREAAGQLSTEETPDATEIVPQRRYVHQVTGAVHLGRSVNSRFGFANTSIGGAMAYHLTRRFGQFRAGAGADLSLMSQTRGENVFALTTFGEYQLFFGGRHLRPIFRFEAGPGLPFGNRREGDEITNRRVGLLIHPSVGVEIQPRENQWGGLFFDLGYRFLNTRFTVVSANLDELERTVNYRRLVFRGGLRF